MNTPLKTERRAFVVLLTGLFILLAYLFKPFLMSILLGMVLVILFHPLYLWFLKICRNHRYPASFLTTFIVLVFIFLPAGLVASLVTNQIIGIVDPVIQFVNKLNFEEAFQKWNVNLQNYITQLEQTFHIQINLRALAANAAKQFAYYIYQYSPAVLAQTITFFAQAFLMLIVVFFLFVEGRGLYHELILLSPLKDTHENALAQEMRNMIYAVVYGSFVTALVQGILAGAGFYFAGIKGYLVWGALTFMFSFIPIIGATGVWLPAVIILFLLGETKTGIFFTFYGAFVISGVDNILKPLLMRGKSKIHPVLLFLAILGGLSLVGPIGILLGPVTVAVFLAALKIYKQDYLLENN